ncbi:MAG TPA: hypothetical protein VFC38_02300 [Stellaceae bacterium]|nr:hypothetical protein [Stellaceae bacterium]
MFLILGAFGVVLGSVSAISAEKFPMHQAKLEQWGGDLFVSGMALLGLGFPLI